jgi:hypothetical protein
MWPNKVCENNRFEIRLEEGKKSTQAGNSKWAQY